jgi:hemolysin III
MNEEIVVVEKPVKEKPSKELPNYTKGEEIFNAVSHIVGGAFGIIALVLGVVYSAILRDWVAIVSMSIYGVSMILLYTMSSIYHFLRRNKAKKVFRVFDHCTIYLLIAGTYTPFCLIALEGVLAGYIVLCFVWILSIIGIILNAINMYKKSVIVFSNISYLAIGWLMIFAILPLINALTATELWLLVAGGLSYTVGAVFYAYGRKARYIHSVWHLFVLAGTFLHFASIFLCLLNV